MEQVRCPLTRFYQWQQNVHGYRGANPAVELKCFVGRQPSKRGRKRDLQWFRPGGGPDAPQGLSNAQATLGGLPRGLRRRGLRWGETAALSTQDIDWDRERVHVAGTWSEGGGRIERCKDGEDRWVKLPPASMAALRAHMEAKDLEGSVKGWPLAARQLVFPTPWAGSDLRWVKDQLGRASIEETEGTYGHLERERHEHRVDLDVVLGIGSGASIGVHVQGPGAQARGNYLILWTATWWWRVRDS